MQAFTALQPIDRFQGVLIDLVSSQSFCNLWLLQTYDQLEPQVDVISALRNKLLSKSHHFQVKLFSNCCDSFVLLILLLCIPHSFAPHTL